MIVGDSSKKPDVFITLTFGDIFKIMTHRKLSSSYTARQFAAETHAAIHVPLAARGSGTFFSIGEDDSFRCKSILEFTQ